MKKSQANLVSFQGYLVCCAEEGESFGENKERNETK